MRAACLATSMVCVLLTSMLGAAPTGAALIEATEIITASACACDPPNTWPVDFALDSAVSLAADLQGKANALISVAVGITANLAGMVNAAVASLAFVIANIVVALTNLFAMELAALLHVTQVLNSVVTILIQLKVGLESITFAALNAIVTQLSNVIGNVTLTLNVSRALDVLGDGAKATLAQLILGAPDAEDRLQQTMFGMTLGAIALLAAAGIAPDVLAMLLGGFQEAGGYTSAFATGAVVPALAGLDGAGRALIGGGIDVMSSTVLGDIGLAALFGLLALLASIALSASASVAGFLTDLASA